MIPSRNSYPGGIPARFTVGTVSDIAVMFLKHPLGWPSRLIVIFPLPFGVPGVAFRQSFGESSPASGSPSSSESGVMAMVVNDQTMGPARTDCCTPAGGVIVAV